MIDALGQHETCARTRRGNVLLKVLQVDAPPDVSRRIDRLRLAQLCVFVEILQFVTERSVLQALEAANVPVLEARLVGVQIDRKIEEV